jgi:hypothetical protein
MVEITQEIQEKSLKNELLLYPLPLLTQNVTKLIVTTLHILRHSL